MYGLSEVFQVPAAPTEVPADWSLQPTDVAAGAKFRLLFLSSTTRDATATDIATYNTFIQTRAAAGHTDIQAYSAGFRVVGCTAAVDARDNTATTYTSADTGVPIYWLNGAKAADDYADFYDGDWDDEANDKNESGTDGPDTSQSANRPWTGCNHNGTKSVFSGNPARARLCRRARRPAQHLHCRQRPHQQQHRQVKDRNPPPVRALGCLPGARRRDHQQPPDGGEPDPGPDGDGRHGVHLPIPDEHVQRYGHRRHAELHGDESRRHDAAHVADLHRQHADLRGHADGFGCGDGGSEGDRH